MVTSSLWQAEDFRLCLSESTVISQEENRAEDHHVLGMVTPCSSPQLSSEGDPNGLRAQRREAFPLHVLGHNQGTHVNPVVSSLFSPAATFPKVRMMLFWLLFIFSAENPMASKLDCQCNKHEPLPHIRSDVLLLGITSNSELDCPCRTKSMASPMQPLWNSLWRVNCLLWFPHLGAASKMRHALLYWRHTVALQQLMPGMQF